MRLFISMWNWITFKNEFLMWKFELPTEYVLCINQYYHNSIIFLFIFPIGLFFFLSLDTESSFLGLNNFDMYYYKINIYIYICMFVIYNIRFIYFKTIRKIIMSIWFCDIVDGILSISMERGVVWKSDVSKVEYAHSPNGI